jgi:DNA-binding CsgD family transcriptional regulator
LARHYGASAAARLRSSRLRDVWTSPTPAAVPRWPHAPGPSYWLAGREPRRFARSGRDALTASELRVARMASEGMSNREIAQALFITIRTVTTHLGHAYEKLGIIGRQQLAEKLAEDTPINVG